MVLYIIYRKELQNFTQRALVKAGILVQVNHFFYPNFAAHQHWPNLLMLTAHHLFTGIQLQESKGASTEGRKNIKSGSPAKSDILQGKKRIKLGAVVCRPAITSSTRWVQTSTLRHLGSSTYLMCSLSTDRGFSKTFLQQGAIIISYISI